MLLDDLTCPKLQTAKIGDMQNMKEELLLVGRCPDYYMSHAELGSCLICQCPVGPASLSLQV